MPAIGYSFYKTPDRVPECVDLAWAAGVRHFDGATQYGTNAAIGQALSNYDNRNTYFVTHKLSNAEQSTRPRNVQRAVQRALSDLQTPYLDLCMIHSPLTDPPRRLATYQALTELQRDGTVRSVGVCHYGVTQLQEIVDAHLPPPAVIQLQLSPFHQHRDVAACSHSQESVLCCAAWSKLSSLDGPTAQWQVVGELAKAKQATKAQILVRWAFQKGYACVPRSAATSKVERQAIGENSWAGCRNLPLSDAEMKLLDGLDVQWPAGRLGVTDGYTVEDILSPEWDPTTSSTII